MDTRFECFSAGRHACRTESGSGNAPRSEQFPKLDWYEPLNHTIFFCLLPNFPKQSKRLKYATLQAACVFSSWHNALDGRGNGGEQHENEKWKVKWMASHYLHLPNKWWDIRYVRSQRFQFSSCRRKLIPNSMDGNGIFLSLMPDAKFSFESKASITSRKRSDSKIRSCSMWWHMLGITSFNLSDDGTWNRTNRCKFQKFNVKLAIVEGFCDADNNSLLRFYL